MSKLAELVTEEYLSHEIEVQPTYPRILVRLLPREQESKGGIVLPEGTAQNKPNLEGIVIRTYEPFWKVYVKSDRQVWEKNSSKVLALNEKQEIHKVWMEAEVKPGDHILFPVMEFGITPVWPLDDGKGDYRNVSEDVIQGIITYKKESDKEWIANTIRDCVDGKAIAARLLEKAHIIRKDLKPRTTSGK